MTGHVSLDLSLSAWSQVDEICDRFEKALRSGRRPLVEEYVPTLEPSVRKRLLRELILVEIEYRRVAGQNPARVEYVSRFPADPEAVDEAFQNSLQGAPVGGKAFDSDAETVSMDLAGQESGPQSGMPKHAEEAATTGKGTDANLGRVIGMYRLVERLGRGGMGTVYRAEHTAIQSERAIKLLRSALAKNPHVVSRFLREAQASVTHLSHPNIVKTFDLLRDADEFYLVMEMIAGCDLYRFVEQKGPLAPYQAAQIIEQAATGLAYAHERGFVHRDIKPHNLMLAMDGTVKILDLGLVRTIDGSPAGGLCSESPASGPGDDSGSPASARFTEEQSVLGTLPYMSPEQIRNSAKADAQSDLYSLGCTLYFLLTGEHAFGGGTPQEIIAAVKANEFRHPRALRTEIPPSLEQIVLRLMCPDPQGRFPNAKHTARVLRSWRLQERLESDRAAGDPVTYETIEELKQVLLSLRIVPETDWKAATQMGRDRGWSPDSVTTMLQTTNVTGPDSQDPERVFEALGMLHRTTGGAHGVSAWQKELIARGSADLLRLPHHVLVERIGVGWKGEVFKARQIESGRLEAVRTFSASALSGLPGDEPERLRKFVEEATRIAAVQHDVFPEVLSFDTCHNRVHPRLAYLATELVEGRFASDFLQTQTWPSEQDRAIYALTIAAQIARGLDVAHRHAILHLDIQHRSILVNAAGHVKLVDLGFAQMVTPRRFAWRSISTECGAAYDVLRTPSGMSPELQLEAVGAIPSPMVFGAMRSGTFEDSLVGTPIVMPPEQWVDRSNVSYATDIYNLGCALWFLLTESYPFQGDNFLELMQRILTQSPGATASINRIPVEARPIVEKMLAKRPEDRFASAAELADRLESVAADLVRARRSHPATTGSWLRRTWRRLSRPRSRKPAR